LMPPPNDITINWRPCWCGRKRPGDGLAASLLGGGNRCILGILGVGNSSHFGTVRMILTAPLDATYQRHHNQPVTALVWA
jgi:hypothetical protein